LQNAYAGYDPRGLQHKLQAISNDLNERCAMQTTNQSPVSEAANEAQSLIGQVFSGVVSAKKDDSLIIAIADPNGAPIPVPGILSREGLIGFTPTIKAQRFALMESGAKLFVRIVALDLESTSPAVHLSEVSSLR
jgi:hypothetical protein